jgi:hypothetical protein
MPFSSRHLGSLLSVLVFCASAIHLAHAADAGDEKGDLAFFFHDYAHLNLSLAVENDYLYPQHDLVSAIFHGTTDKEGHFVEQATLLDGIFTAENDAGIGSSVLPRVYL